MMNERVPPGQHLTERFPVLHYGEVPAFNPSTWDFRIWGEVEEPVVWTWDEVMALPRVRLNLDLHCVTTWSKLDMVWEGISLRKLVEDGLVKPKPVARFVMQHADGGYSTNLPLAVMLQDNFLLATHCDGQPLSPEHGYPLRGVVGAIPGRDDLKDVYLWKGAKWLRGLEFLSADQLGFWEANGYSNEADIWKEQRFSR
ncbi:MAG: sulfite oxidase-like oxidoreductase [Anaerolineaceae bacterium]|nr:sulfite oxidase-like oxidoreductase [Anaerolineaceae bacterium]